MSRAQPVDVLALLDRARLFTDPQSDGGESFRDEISQARAAIAELIEAAAVVIEPYRGDAYAGPDIERLEDALARVVGAP